MESGGENLKLHAYTWESFYTQRVIWALKIKGIDYDCVKEYHLPPGESYLTFLYNPAHKRTPMLVHNGKPLTDSLVIIEYIDETWKHDPLLPSDPYERANARFWAKFSDDKCYPTIMRVLSSKGDEQKEAVKEARDAFKTLEGGLEGKRFFGGEKIGFADVAIGWIGRWVRVVEQILKVKLIDENEVPVLSKWVDDFLETLVIKESLPPSLFMMLRVSSNLRKMLAGTWD